MSGGRFLCRRFARPSGAVQTAPARACRLRRERATARAASAWTRPSTRRRAATNATSRASADRPREVMNTPGEPGRRIRRYAGMRPDRLCRSRPYSILLRRRAGEGTSAPSDGSDRRPCAMPRRCTHHTAPTPYRKSRTDHSTCPGITPRAAAPS